MISQRRKSVFVHHPGEGDRSVQASICLLCQQQPVIGSGFTSTTPLMARWFVRKFLACLKRVVLASEQLYIKSVLVS